jgi:hypothetical protein
MKSGSDAFVPGLATACNRTDFLSVDTQRMGESCQAEKPVQPLSFLLLLQGSVKSSPTMDPFVHPACRYACVRQPV